MESKPYVQTYAIVVGDTACNAKCPYCVSKMTPSHRIAPNINWDKFKKGAVLASKWGATTCLLTGKGEATLFPLKCKCFIEAASKTFPIVELQTNGILLPNMVKDGTLRKWCDAGLTTIAISSVSPDLSFNRKLISPDYPDMKDLVPKLKSMGLCVRFSVIMVKGGVDSYDDVIDTIRFANEIGVDQLKIYPVSKPDNCRNSYAQWVDENMPSYIIEGFVSVPYMHPIRKLAHGDMVYSYRDSYGICKNGDQNISIGSCLTEGHAEDEIRQLIFCSDNHVRYSWQYNAAILF